MADPLEHVVLPTETWNVDGRNVIVWLRCPTLTEPKYSSDMGASA